MDRNHDLGAMVAPGQGRQMLDTRNWSMTRGSWTGQKCGHYDTSGNSGQQYNGTLNDPIWREYQISLVSNIQIWLHANYPGIALEANLAWDVNYLADELSFLKRVDIWFDEQGFTDGNSGGGDFTDQARQGKALAVNQIVHTAPKVGLPSTRPRTLSSTDRTPSGSRRSAFTCCSRTVPPGSGPGHSKNKAACTSHRSMLPRRSAPRPTPTMPAKACTADFTNGLVFVNRSSTTSHKITIPANAYKRLYGALQRRTITLAPRKRNRTSTHPTTRTHLHH